MYYTQRLLELREYAELTQTEVAEVLGMKQEQYQRYESGKNEIKASHIIKICKFYNVSPEYLLCFTDIKKNLPRK